MFKNNFIVNVKVNGEILRERDGIVYIPFGSNYSIFMKNLESRKAKIKISIDGEDVLDGNGLIISENSVGNIEGFFKGTVEKNKFLFTQKTKEILDYRGDRIDDGILRVEMFYERKIVSIPVTTYISWSSPNYIYPSNNPILRNYSSEIVVSCMNSSDNSAGLGVAGSKPSLDSFNSMLDSVDGITVKGKEIHNQYNYGYIGTLEDVSTVFVLQLKGMTEENIQVEKPLIVKDRLICSTCGRTSKSDSKYCGNCGTYLKI
jgi:hypothetical protein